jgi:hypothetical protein
MANYKVYFYSFTPGEHGQGHVTRALAIRNALDRLGVLGSGENQIQFHFCGIPDAPELWLDKTTMHVFGGNDGVLYERPKTPDATRQVSNAVSAFVENLQPDLLLLDVRWDTLENYLADDNRRPPAVWGISRYKKEGFGRRKRILDRLYLTERFAVENWQHNSGITRERCRNEYEKTGALGPYHVPFNPAVYKTHAEWQKQFHHNDRKELAPIVNMAKEEVLSREAAKKYLVKRFKLSSQKPIALVIGRTRNFAQVDRIPFTDWVNQTVVDKSYQVVYTGGVNVNDTTPDPHGYSYIPDLMRYVPSADLVLSHCGYNTFYGLRLLKQWGLYTGGVQFYPLANMTNDQKWRFDNSSEQFANNSWFGGLFSTNQSRYSTPTGNGADELARLIARKAGINTGSQND